jgi:hypothetical protein
MTSRSVAAIGGIAAVLTIVGVSGVGDAPAPLEEARLMADHFQSVRVDVFIGAAIGLVGAAAMSGFGLAFASRLARVGERAAGLAIGAGLAVVVGYLLATHVVYTTLSYAVASTSADVTKGMFVATILAVPVFGLGVATLLFGAAFGSWRAGLMPPWWRTATLAAGTLSTVAVFSYADGGFFSPDVQQQVIAHILVVWLLATSVACVIRPAHLGHDTPDRRHLRPASRPQPRDQRADSAQSRCDYEPVISSAPAVATLIGSVIDSTPINQPERDTR